MSEYGWIIGLGFFLIILFGGGFMEFLETRRQQKFAHEREMARIKASAARAARRKDGATKDNE